MKCVIINKLFITISFLKCLSTEGHLKMNPRCWKGSDFIFLLVITNFSHAYIDLHLVLNQSLYKNSIIKP